MQLIRTSITIMYYSTHSANCADINSMYNLCFTKFRSAYYPWKLKYFGFVSTDTASQFLFTGKLV